MVREKEFGPPTSGQAYDLMTGLWQQEQEMVWQRRVRSLLKVGPTPLGWGGGGSAAYGLVG